MVQLRFHHRLNYVTMPLVLTAIASVLLSTPTYYTYFTIFHLFLEIQLILSSTLVLGREFILSLQNNLNKSNKFEISGSREKSKLKIS